VKDSVWTVLTYGGLRGQKHRAVDTGVRTFDELPANHTLAEMLAALIDAVATEELHPKNFNSTVRFNWPRPAAEVQYHMPGSRTGFEDAIAYELKPKTKWPSESRDLFRATEFSEETILRVGAVIRISE
jgi:hypothetical protein